MKKISKIILSTIILSLIIQITPVNALELSTQDIKEIRKQIDITGIDSKYSDNIVNYMKNLELSKDELILVEKTGMDLINMTYRKKSITDFSFGEIYNVYKKVSSLASQLNIGFSINFLKMSLVLRDKSNDALLLSTDINEIQGFMNNVKENNSSKDLVAIADKIEANIFGNSSGFSNKVYNSNIPYVASNIVDEAVGANTSVSNKYLNKGSIFSSTNNELDNEKNNNKYNSSSNSTNTKDDLSNNDNISSVTDNSKSVELNNQGNKVTDNSKSIDNKESSINNSSEIVSVINDKYNKVLFYIVGFSFMSTLAVLIKILIRI